VLQEQDSDGPDSEFADLKHQDVERKLRQGTYHCCPKPGAKAGYWNSFDIIRNEKNVTIPFIQCKKCKKVLKRASNAGSSAFNKHISFCQTSSSKQRTLFEFQHAVVSVILFYTLFNFICINTWSKTRFFSRYRLPFNFCNISTFQKYGMLTSDTIMRHTVSWIFGCVKTMSFFIKHNNDLWYIVDIFGLNFYYFTLAYPFASRVGPVSPKTVLQYRQVLSTFIAVNQK